MPANLEIKAILANREFALAQAALLGAKYAGRLHQVDVYFKTVRGRLKLRSVAGGGAELIYYERDEASDERMSRFERYEAPEPDRLRAMLQSSCGVRGVVEKTRDLWMYGDTRIHFDLVRDLGSFLEIEVPVGASASGAETVMRTLLEGLKIGPSEFIRTSYIDLLLAREESARLGAKS